jgi:DNA (cytosine-5)-methyltransferase 1
MVEWDGDAVATVLHNKKRNLRHVRDWPLQGGDVRSVDWRQFGDLDLVAGGPPCQPFSIGGKHRGHDDTRDMWPEAIRAIRETMPRAFLFENVRGLARPAFAFYLDWIVAHLQHPDIERGTGEDHAAHTARLNNTREGQMYRVKVFKVNAADYGAPQKRHRVVVAGVRADIADRLPELEQTHSRERLLWDQWITGDYWRRHKLVVPNADAIGASDRSIVNRLRSANIPPTTRPWVTVRDALSDLGDPTGRSNHLFQDGARVYPGHTGSPLDQPAKALKAGDHGVPGGENMLVRDDDSVRYFTTREAARLQGLPDDYEFPRSWTESMRQLGNAVPSQLGEALGQWIIGVLSAANRVKSAA